jgi:hypothetical protein
MVKTYHTIDFGEWQSLIKYFHPIHGSHWMAIPDAKLSPEDWHDMFFKNRADGQHHLPSSDSRVLISAHFMDESSEEGFHELATTKLSLPHPIFQGADLIAPAHVEELYPMFCGACDLYDEFPTVQAKRDAASTANVRDIVRRISKNRPSFRLSVF